MFDNFKIGVDNGIIGTDYDSLHSYWPTSGIANYILARAHIYPDKNFKDWENEYCSAYGAAQEDIKNFYAYWRTIWDNRLMKDRAEIAKVGRYGNFRRGLMWCLSKYYNEKDFDVTDAILSSAMKKQLSPLEKERLKKVMLANEHARLMHKAILVNGRIGGAENPIDRIGASRELLEFRKKNKDTLTFNWSLLFNLEKSFGDVTGVQFAQLFEKKIDPIKGLPIYWNFKIDPKNIGVKEGWEKISWNEIKKGWEKIRTDRNWENQKKVDKKLEEQLRNYDGVGWYAVRFKVDPKLRGKKIYALFGAVDESCWVYLNGKKAGEHLYKKPDDWKTPFSIDITKNIDWNKSTQQLVVKVEDKAGMGGIWKLVWIAKEK
ncbi:MAG: hypothetical protein U9O87_00955 [Verrucomicrobiota bacterium]|nr:hypothetical protein [Verrucomicrobiota bacterium]